MRFSTFSFYFLLVYARELKEETKLNYSNNKFFVPGMFFLIFLGDLFILKVFILKVNYSIEIKTI